ncbi:hypothetical protein GCK32_016301, partial [Trichostrongylus colubriformis]
MVWYTHRYAEDDANNTLHTQDKVLLGIAFDQADEASSERRTPPQLENVIELSKSLYDAALPAEPTQDDVSSAERRAGLREECRVLSKMSPHLSPTPPPHRVTSSPHLPTASPALGTVLSPEVPQTPPPRRASLSPHFSPSAPPQPVMEKRSSPVVKKVTTITKKHVPCQYLGAPVRRQVRSRNGSAENSPLEQQ